MSELPFTIATENKIPRNTTNKGCEGTLQGKLQTTVKEIREDIWGKDFLFNK